MLGVLLAVLFYAAWPSIHTFGWHFLGDEPVAAE